MISLSDRAKIKDLAVRHQVASVRLFGSQANGTATKSSDIDLLVKFTNSPSLLDLIGFKQALEKALVRKVDVVEEDAISPYIRDRILSEMSDNFC